jgi:hypothetical protein
MSNHNDVHISKCLKFNNAIEIVTFPQCLEIFICFKDYPGKSQFIGEGDGTACAVGLMK